MLGIVSAAISLLLEATYSNGTLVGHGQLSIKIQICWCFTLEVNESVTYNLTSGKKTAAAGIPPDAFDLRANEYVQMLV